MVRALLRVAAAADYRERSWPPSQSVCGFAHCESAQFAARKPTRMVMVPNYHQPGADLRVLPVGRAATASRSWSARTSGSTPPRSSAPSAASEKAERLLSTSYAPLQRQMTPNQRRRLEDKRGTDRGGAKERFKRSSARPRSAPPRGGAERDREGRRGPPPGAGRGLQRGLGLRALPALGDPRQGRLRRGQRRRGPDVRRRGARRRGGPPGPSVRRPGRRLPHRAARGDRAEARGRLHRERPQMPSSRQPRPAAGGDRLLPALPRAAGRVDPASSDRNSRATSRPSCSPPTRPGSPRFAARRRIR